MRAIFPTVVFYQKGCYMTVRATC